MILQCAQGVLISILVAAISFLQIVQANPSSDVPPSHLSPAHLRQLKYETKELFLHAWDSYMNYGFPADEVTPISCQPYGPDFYDIDDLVRNDAMGNTSLTILDNLDSLIILEEWDRLSVVLDYLQENPDLFNQNTIIQVFESTIRSLGGLMSSHLLLETLRDDPQSQALEVECIKKYDGFLLELALDLGYRLIPAFKTTTQMPVPRINLSKGVKGVPSRLQKETCTAGAASPVLEFTLLSKLSGDLIFENYTQQTFWKLWSSKLTLNLLPMTLDPLSSLWKDSTTGIGASVDSFYEYAAKFSILFDDKDMWNVFKTSYKALLTHLVYEPLGSINSGAAIFSNIEVNNGRLASVWLDLLGAFWSGLQVLTGQVKDAVRTHMMYLKIWNTYDLIPERLDFVNRHSEDERPILLEWYPLRPEFIESTYYLYRATRDPMYLQIGERVLELLQTKFKQRCGFSGFQNVLTGELQDRMETFVMSETLKYLYLLFDTEDKVLLHSNLMSNKNWVFSTEAHPLWYDKRKTIPTIKKKLEDRRINNENSIRSSLLDRITAKFNMYGSLSDNITIAQKAPHFYPNYYTTGDQENVIKVDPYEEKFNRCEVSPFSTGPFISLGYYTLNNLFSSNAIYGKVLKRPKHLGPPKDIELNENFYNQFSLVQNSLQCGRLPTTELSDIVLGNINFMSSIQISKLPLIKTKGEKHEYDLWIPKMASSRLKIEKLEVDKVDTMNNRITKEYIDSFFIDKSDPIFTIENGTTIVSDIEVDPTSVLRVLQVNGVDVDPQGLIWTLPYLGEILKYTSRNRVVLEGMVVENILSWW